MKRSAKPGDSHEPPMKSKFTVLLLGLVPVAPSP